MKRQTRAWYTACRMVRETSPLPEPVHNPEDVATLIRAQTTPQELAERESFYVVALDTRHRVLTIETVSVGTLSASIVHPREIFRRVLTTERPTASVIIAHNHPSGDVWPSNDDLEITRRLHQAGELLGIPVIDHVILGWDRMLSLKAEGLI